MPETDAAPPPAPPPELARLAPGWTATPAWDRPAEAVSTWRLEAPDGAVHFAKIDRAGCFPSLAAEAEHMVWAVAYLPVPRVVALEQGDGATILLTEALPGRDGTDPAWRSDLPGHVRALGRGLRAFHDAVGEEWCPFRFDLERALNHVGRRVGSGQVGPAAFHPEHAHHTPASALAELEATAPASEDLVVCHGDYCAPNVLRTGNAVTGYVDLGELGVADRWWDLAVGGWSTCWNFGEEFEPLFYESYGIDPDPARIRFYRLLYDLVC